jgi:hypothetical protein
MIRRLFTVVSTVSLLLCVATAVARPVSYWREFGVGVRRNYWQMDAIIDRGTIICNRYVIPDADRWNVFWTPPIKFPSDDADYHCLGFALVWFKPNGSKPNGKGAISNIRNRTRPVWSVDGYITTTAHTAAAVNHGVVSRERRRTGLGPVVPIGEPRLGLRTMRWRWVCPPGSSRCGPISSWRQCPPTSTLLESLPTGCRHPNAQTRKRDRCDFKH